MPRKKRHEEHENHERWLVSYADFITLLFAFFTSLYALSSVNEGKYRVLSESMAQAFNPSLYASEMAGEGAGFVTEPDHSMSDAFKANFNRHYRKVRDELKGLEEDNKLTLLFDDEKVTIRISGGTLFRSESDEIMPEGMAVLDELSVVLKNIPGNVNIEGHTDNIPIETEEFPSNWDLSSARAVRVLKYLVVNNGMEPDRLGATGYGEYRPIGSNGTSAGRAKNRRVDVLVYSSEEL